MATYELPRRMVWSRVASGALAGGLVSVAGMVGALLITLPYVSPAERHLECVTLDRPAERQRLDYREAGAPARQAMMFCIERPVP